METLLPRRQQVEFLVSSDPLREVGDGLESRLKVQAFRLVLHLEQEELELRRAPHARAEGVRQVGESVVGRVAEFAARPLDDGLQRLDDQVHVLRLARELEAEGNHQGHKSHRLLHPNCVFFLFFIIIYK